MNIRIESDGSPYGTKVFNADTGEHLEKCYGVTWNHEAGQNVKVDLRFRDASGVLRGAISANYDIPTGESHREVEQLRSRLKTAVFCLARIARADTKRETIFDASNRALNALYKMDYIDAVIDWLGLESEAELTGYSNQNDQLPSA
jgi:hypothetical protein